MARRYTSATLHLLNIATTGIRLTYKYQYLIDKSQNSFVLFYFKWKCNIQSVNLVIFYTSNKLFTHFLYYHFSGLYQPISSWARKTLRPQWKCQPFWGKTSTIWVEAGTFIRFHFIKFSLNFVNYLIHIFKINLYFFTFKNKSYETCSDHTNQLSFGVRYLFFISRMRGY